MEKKDWMINEMVSTHQVKQAKNDNGLDDNNNNNDNNCDANDNNDSGSQPQEQQV